VPRDAAALRACVRVDLPQALHEAAEPVIAGLALFPSRHCALPSDASQRVVWRDRPPAVLWARRYPSRTGTASPCRRTSSRPPALPEGAVFRVDEPTDERDPAAEFGGHGVGIGKLAISRPSLLRNFMTDGALGDLQQLASVSAACVFTGVSVIGRCALVVEGTQTDGVSAFAMAAASTS